MKVRRGEARERRRERAASEIDLVLGAKSDSRPAGVRGAVIYSRSYRLDLILHALDFVLHLGDG
jgi:hypothetical protein